MNGGQRTNGDRIGLALRLGPLGPLPENPLIKSGLATQIGLLIAVAAIYIGAAKLGLLLAFLNASVSPVWPPTGVAIAAVLLLGYRVSPAIFVGALLANLATGLPLAPAGGIAVGNTLEALSAAFLLHHFVGFHNPFYRARDVLKFVILAALLSPTLAATIGNASLCIGGAASWTNFGSLWLTWWIGDGVGALVVTPLILTWVDRSSERWPPPRWVESVLLLLSLSAASTVLFREALPNNFVNVSLGRLIIPFLLWGALRLGPRGVATAIALYSGIAIWGTRMGLGPMVGQSPNDSLLLLQVSVAANGITFLVLAGLVAERKRAEHELENLLEREQDARAEAEAANRAKDEFLALVSHELRTPLNAIVGWVEILLADTTKNEAFTARAVEVIRRNAGLQTRIIEDILDVSRIVAGKLQLDIRPVELPALVRSTVAAVQLTASQKDIRLRHVLEPLSDPISGDGQRLQQVIWNLLSNAIKFTPAGGEVEIRLEQIGSNAQITVSDTGVGIPAKFLPRIFDRFSQADSSTTRRYGGLGLGLAIVRHLVELHGGTVEAYSAGENRGAVFTLTLPCAPARSKSPLQMPSSDDARKEQDSLPTLDGVRVLIVDDDADSRDVLAALLALRGAEARTVASVREALEVLTEWNPDVLVSDIGMPDEDGYDLIRKLRAREAGEGGRIPAIALTGYAAIEEGERAMSAGYQMHLGKPIEPNHLVNVIARFSAKNGGDPTGR